MAQAISDTNYKLELHKQGLTAVVDLIVGNPPGAPGSGWISMVRTFNRISMN